MNINHHIISRSLPFVLFTVAMAFDSFFAHWISLLGWNPKLSYGFRILLALGALIYFWRDYIELKALPVISDFFYAAIAGGIVFIIWIFPYPDWLIQKDPFVYNPFLESADISLYLWLFIRIAGSVLVVPVVEELFWRSYVMRWFDQTEFLSFSPDKVSGYAQLGSACLFAIGHELWFPALIAGLVYGELYKTYKTLWAPVIAHAVTNGLLAIWIVGLSNWGYW